MDNKELKDYMDDKFDQLTRHIDDKMLSQGKLFDNKLGSQKETIDELRVDLKQNAKDISEAKGSVKMFKYLLSIIVLIAGLIIGILQYASNDSGSERMSNGVKKSVEKINN